MTHLENVYRLTCDLRLELQKALIVGEVDDINSFRNMLDKIENYALANLSGAMRVSEEMQKDKDAQ